MLQEGAEADCPRKGQGCTVQASSGLKFNPRADLDSKYFWGSPGRFPLHFQTSPLAVTIEGLRFTKVF